MNYFTRISFLICTAIILSNCGGSSAGTDSIVIAPPITPPISSDYQQPDTMLCDANLTTASGFLCAIQPSRIDANSRDVFGINTNQDFLLGFGYHAVAFPITGTEIKGINIHLTGSYGRAYNQFNDRFASSLFLEESMAAGFITIQLAYDNRFAINLDECAGDSSKLNVDNCAGDVRLEKITGDDVSSVANTPLEDSIEYRLIALVEFFQSQGFEFPQSIVTSGNINWDSLYVSGHSQGGNHALYLGKYFSASHVCMLAAGFDAADTVPVIPTENIADWFLDDSVVLDIGKVSAIVSIDDDSYNAFIRGYGVLGLIENIHFEEFSGAPYSNVDGIEIDGHAAALNDPRFSSLRTNACFTI